LPTDFNLKLLERNQATIQDHKLSPAWIYLHHDTSITIRLYFRFLKQTLKWSGYVNRLLAYNKVNKPVPQMKCATIVYEETSDQIWYTTWQQKFVLNTDTLISKKFLAIYLVKFVTHFQSQMYSMQQWHIITFTSIVFDYDNILLLSINQFLR